MNLKIISLLVLALFSLNSCEKTSFEEDGALVPLTVMEDSSIPSININGVLLHSETYGNPSDPMMIVIHGGPGADHRSLLNFKEFADESIFVVFYDQRGSGLSQRIDRDEYPAVQVYVDELDGVIKHYRQNSSQKVVLAGHSWGAMLATAYINQKPDEITGVVLAEPGGLTWPQTETYLQKTRKIELFAEATNDFVYMDQFITGSEHNVLDYKMALSVAGDVTTGDIAPPPFWRYGGICNLASIELAINNPDQLNFTKNLGAYTSKVLFAYSELNSAYGSEHAESVAASFPNVELVEILGCGHEMPHFGWNNLYPVINNYLKEIL